MGCALCCVVGKRLYWFGHHEPLLNYADFCARYWLFDCEVGFYVAQGCGANSASTYRGIALSWNKDCQKLTGHHHLLMRLRTSTHNHTGSLSVTRLTVVWAVTYSFYRCHCRNISDCRVFILELFSLCLSGMKCMFIFDRHVRPSYLPCKCAFRVVESLVLLCLWRFPPDCSCHADCLHCVIHDATCSIKC